MHLVIKQALHDIINASGTKSDSTLGSACFVLLSFSRRIDIFVLGSRIDISRILIFFSKFRTAVYPLNKAQIVAKLWQNAFQTICNFSFFDADKNFGPKNFQKILEVNFCFQETGVLEELGRFERHWHVRRKKLLPLMRLFWGRLPWRGGKRLNMCRKPRLGTENDFNHLVL